VGSEYIAQELTDHPALSMTMYTVNALRFIGHQYDPLTNGKNLTAALTALKERVVGNFGHDFDLQKVFKIIREENAKTVYEIYDILMRLLYLNEGTASHWAEKNQLLWRQIPDFLTHMPNGKAILILRDPRNVLLSFRHFTNAPAPAYLGAIFNCLDAMQCAAHYQETLPQERFLLLRFEDFVANPQDYKRKCYTFLGLDLNNAPTQKPCPQWQDAHGNPWTHNTAFPSQDGQFDVQASFERWKTGLSQDELALCETVCGEMMKKFSYTPSTNAPALNPRWIKEVCAQSPHVTNAHTQWKTTGSGIQAFPTDPLSPQNWEKKNA